MELYFGWMEKLTSAIAASKDTQLTEPRASDFLIIFIKIFIVDSLPLRAYDIFIDSCASTAGELVATSQKAGQDVSFLFSGRSLDLSLRGLC